MLDLYAKSQSTCGAGGSKLPSKRWSNATSVSHGLLSRATLARLTLCLLSLTVSFSTQGCCPKRSQVVIVGKSEIRRLSTGEYVVPAARMQRIMERCGKCAAMLKECSARLR